ncbi:uncharacterized protein A4U43_C05F2230 [Asparagus officinalis]|uniref:Uncharacterized protein n=1 Tax=Asparagus officinalis TaxID=4686 RepID=A0A5P1ENQ6_ASPOF|nr:uncharacterized protein A4U43_C05F2230 [Asparagus officinalis]
MKVEASGEGEEAGERDARESSCCLQEGEGEEKKCRLRADEEPKRKFGEQKRAGSREIEKWMRVHEPIPMMMGQVKDEKVELKGVAQAEVRARVASNLGQDEKDMKGILLSPESIGVVKKEERSLPGGGEKGPRLPKSTQDELVSRANSRSLFTGSPSIARLNS